MEAVFGPSVSSRYARAIEAEVRKGDMLVATAAATATTTTTAAGTKACISSLITAIAVVWAPFVASVSIEPDSPLSYLLLAICGAVGAWLATTHTRAKDASDMARRIMAGVFVAAVVAFPVCKKFWGRYDPEVILGVAASAGFLSWNFLEALQSINWKRIFTKAIENKTGATEPPKEQK